MALKNSIKKSLVSTARENTSVTRGTRSGQTTLKKGVPSDYSRKHLDGKVPVVGISEGITKNMDNYESLRADVWLTDEVHEGESLEEAYARVSKVVSEVLQSIVNEYV